jgi:hypothetical protein
MFPRTLQQFLLLLGEKAGMREDDKPFIEFILSPLGGFVFALTLKPSSRVTFHKSWERESPLLGERVWVREYVKPTFFLLA